MRQARLRSRRLRAHAHNDRDHRLGVLRVRCLLLWHRRLADRGDARVVLLLLSPAVHKSNCRVASQVSGAPDSLFDLRTGHPCAFIFINIARCAAFNTPLQRRDAQNTPPTPAQQWLPAVATEWAFVEAPPLAAVEMTPADTVVEQPTATLPSAKAVLP